MRVAHFFPGHCNPESANGVDKAVYHLSKEQAACGHTVAVLELTSKTPIAIPGVEVRCYPPRRFRMSLPGELLADLAEWRPDLVHLHSVFVLVNAALAAWLHRRKIPYALTPHCSFSPTMLRRNRLVKLAYKWVFELPTLNRAVFVHAVNEGHRFGEYGVRRPIIVAHNGIDLSSIPSLRHEDLLASRWPMARGKKVFLFLGRLDPYYKGLDLLLKGFALAALPGAVLVLVGPDYRGRRRMLEAEARRLGIAPQVGFLGPEYGGGKFDLLAGADVFVLCSRTEGLPMAVLEAAACEKPCMLSEAANPAGLVERCRAGIVVPLESAGIGEGFKRLARMDQAELRRMGRNAREMAETRFDWKRTARILTGAYETCTGIGHR